MRNSSGCALGMLAAVCTMAVHAHAQTPYTGFAVERLAPPVTGGGWFTGDAMDQHGALGGLLALTLGYAARPLVIPTAGGSLALVSDQAFANVGVAVTWQRFRLSVDFNTPLWLAGQGGMAGGVTYTPPSVDVGSNPDTLSDVRLGIAVRLAGEPAAALRLGASAEVIIPSGQPADFDTDGTWRGRLRVHLAGDAGLFTYATSFGVHIRPRDDWPALEAPRGSELLGTVAAGVRFALGEDHGLALVLGPELTAATALRAPLGTDSTAVEGLVGARVEGTADQGMQYRVKLAAGAGLDDHLGTPAWRVLLGIEVFNRSLGR